MIYLVHVILQDIQNPEKKQDSILWTHAANCTEIIFKTKGDVYYL